MKKDDQNKKYVSSVLQTANWLSQFGIVVITNANKYNEHVFYVAYLLVPINSCNKFACTPLSIGHFGPFEGAAGVKGIIEKDLLRQG